MTADSAVRKTIDPANCSQDVKGENQLTTHTRSRSNGPAKLMLAVLGALVFMATPAAAQFELIIGEERFYPGLVLIFEGAVRDHVEPVTQHLEEEKTHVHIEARANWGEDASMLPPGTPPGGFVAYMIVHAEVMNEITGAYTYATLTPHVNLIDSLHYARNIALPGSASDPYKVTFFVNPPDEFEVALHRDWLNAYGEILFPAKTFTYRSVDFTEIVNAPPRASAFETPTVQ